MSNRISFTHKGVTAELAEPVSINDGLNKLVIAYVPGTDYDATGVLLAVDDPAFSSQDPDVLIAELRREIDRFGWDWENEGLSVEAWCQEDRETMADRMLGHAGSLI